MKKTYKLTYTAMLLALTVVLSIFENMLPALPSMPPGVKLGLSNIAVMYAVFFAGIKSSFFLAFSKGFFSFITKGFLAGILSLCGGVLSVLVIIIAISIFKEKISYIMISVLGAVFHNVGQVSAITLMLKVNYFYYLPVLIISGIIMGSITGVILNMIMPVFNKIFKDERNRL